VIASRAATLRGNHLDHDMQIIVDLCPSRKPHLLDYQAAQFASGPKHKHGLLRLGCLRW
jgi:hypothetical protein